MRFRAKLTAENVVILHGVSQTFEKLSSVSVMVLSEENVRIAAVCESIDNTRLYSDIRSLDLFADYKIESQSSNTILFELNMDLFSRALASGKNSPMCLIKLVKRGTKPFLCFEAKAVEGLSVDIIHDIPIKVLKSTEILYHLPPEISEPTVAIELPKNKMMRSIVDRMAKLAKKVEIIGSQSGRITFHIEHGSVGIRTFYNGLQPRFDQILDPEIDMDNTATVTVDIKKLSTMLNLSHLAYNSAILYLTEDAALMVHVTLEAGSLTFFSPVLANFDGDS